LFGVNAGRAPVEDRSVSASAEDIPRLAGAVGGSSGGGLFGALGSGLKSFGSWLGFFDQDTAFVPRTGLAMLHRGEAVIPAAENARGRSGRPIQIIQRRYPAVSRAGRRRSGARAQAPGRAAYLKRDLHHITSHSR
jgi:hypothetical protein